MPLLQLIAALFVFVGIFAGCMAALLLVILMVRLPLLLIALVLTCWFFSRLRNTKDKTPG